MTMTKRLMVTLLAVTLCISQALCQAKFRLIDTADGLPDNEVKALFHAPDGRLGVCTSSSLSLFDGCTFRSFSLPGGTPCKLYFVTARPSAYVDGHRRVWIKEAGRAVVFDLPTERFLPDAERLLRKMGAKGKIANFFIDEAKDFWIADPEGRITLCHQGKGRTLPLTAKGLRGVCRTGGEAWLAFADGWVACVEVATLKTLCKQRLWTAAAGQRDFVYFAKGGDRAWLMWPHGVAALTPKSRHWRTLHTDEANTLISIGATADGKAQVGVRHKGLLTLTADGTASLQTSFDTMEGERFRDDIEAITTLDGNLFVGLYTRGLCQCNEAMQGFPYYSFDQLGVSLTGNYKLSAHAMGKAVLAHSGGLALYDPSAHTLSPILPELEGGDFIRTFTDSRQRMWIGTFRHGFFVADKDGIHHYEQGEKPSQDINFNIVRNFAEDSHGRIYASFHGGIGRIDEATGRIIPLQDKRLQACKVVNDLCIDRHNRLWAASNTGLLAYSIDEGKLSLAADLVTDKEARQALGGACKALCIDSRGTVWVGQLGGLYALDPTHRTCRRYGKADGMPGEMVQAIVEASDGGGVWVATAGGLCRFMPKEGGHTLTVFDSQNKLADSKFLSMALTRLEGGRLLAGCAKGLYEIAPSAVKAICYGGRPLLTSITVNNHELTPGTTLGDRIPLDSALQDARRITLRHDENFVTLRFTGLNFDMPRHTYYRYRLHGVDRDWVETSPQDGVGTATYSELSPGSYTFEVYSAGFDRQWSSRPATIEIVIEQAWWLTWWMKSLYLAAAAALVAALLWWRREQKRRKKEMEELRQRLEAVMGSTLVAAPAPEPTKEEPAGEPSADELWLREVTACIEKNLANSEYSVENLARDVLMSRMGLYRKLKSLIGQTPAELIRTVRLKSAARLLQTGRHNVSEVAYMVGFASPQNFSKHFKETFGTLPSQYGVENRQ